MGFCYIVSDINRDNIFTGKGVDRRERKKHRFVRSAKPSRRPRFFSPPPLSAVPPPEVVSGAREVPKEGGGAVLVPCLGRGEAGAAVPS
jgi:hypothetical protein